MALKQEDLESEHHPFPLCSCAKPPHAHDLGCRRFRSTQHRISDVPHCLNTKTLQDEGGSSPSLFHTCVVRAGFLTEGQLFPKGHKLGPEGDSSASGCCPTSSGCVGRDKGSNKVHQWLLTWEMMNKGQGPSRSSHQELEERMQRQDKRQGCDVQLGGPNTEPALLWCQWGRA